jgi:cobalt-zinc-cadmium efflux system membrane fusion protein
MKNIIIISALFLMTACGPQNPTEEPKADANANQNIVILTEAQFKSAGIVFGKLENKSIASLLRANGTIDVPPQNMISVSMPLGGYLKSIQTFARNAGQKRRKHCNYGRPAIHTAATGIPHN